MEETIILTEMEKTAMKAIDLLNYAEYGFSDYDAQDVSDRTEIPINVMRGVIGSLVKKNLLWIEEYEKFGMKLVGKVWKNTVIKRYQMIHLTDDGYRYLGREDEIE